MRFILSGLAIGLLFVAAILSPLILPEKPIPGYDDQALRQMALSRNLKPIPRDEAGLLEAVDNPDNPMSREKTALGKNFSLTQSSLKIRRLIVPVAISSKRVAMTIFPLR